MRWHFCHFHCWPAGLGLHKMPHVLCVTKFALLTPKGTQSPWWNRKGPGSTALRDAVGRNLMPLADIWMMQCECRLSFLLFCLVLDALEISGMGLGEPSARWSCGWAAFKGPARAFHAPNSICAHLCCSGTKGTNCFLNLTEQFSFLC